MKKQNTKCVWEFDSFGCHYFFECNSKNRAFEFTYTIKERDFKFCPYCGREIEILEDNNHKGEL